MKQGCEKAVRLALSLVVQVPHVILSRYIQYYHISSIAFQAASAMCYEGEQFRTLYLYVIVVLV